MSPHERPTTILVVEDEPALRSVARRVLGNRLGYQVLVVDRAEDALARIDLGDRVDLVLSDLHLPGMDGLELYAGLRDRGFRGKFVLTSGSAPDDPALTHALPPSVPFLPRPWTVDDLTQVIWRALGEA
jgi:two-component system cell cycle sensor histidine kinase/response regulator CckA